MMNAHKFVAEKGIDDAKRVLEGAPDWANFWISRDQYHGHIISFPNMTGHYSIKLSELKQVVESVDLVKSYGGIINTRMDIRYLDIDWDYDSPRRIRLKQATADYELVQAYKNGDA